MKTISTNNNVKNNNVKKTLIFSLFILATLAMSIPVLAACGTTDPIQYRKSIETYYETRYDTSQPFDSRGTYVVNNDGSAYYRIRLRGILYYPCAAVYRKTAQFPAIIVNHGSGAEFEADNLFWQIANYFVPKGYILFMPFRRGQGDDDAPYPNDPVLTPSHISDKSTGIDIDEMLNDWASGSPAYFHDTQCTNTSCYRAQLLKEQADEEIVAAINYMRSRSDVKRDPDVGAGQGELDLGIVGNSYGGAVTVFANRFSLGHKSIVAFSPGAQQWDPNEDCLIGDPICGTPFQRALVSAAGGAVKAAYYLQARWDYDTRATIDLAYAHAYYSATRNHHRGYMASIFPYTYLCATADPNSCTSDDYQSIHIGFFRDPDVWGPSVRNFLKRNM